MITTTHTDENVLATSSGVALRYATRGSSTSTTIIFIHGWPDSWRSFEPVMAALPADVSALSVSLRGFGGSTAPASRFAPDDFADDVRDLAEALGVSSAVVVGHSMGTLVAQRLAARHPALVAGLVLIGGFTRLPEEVFAEVWSAVEELADPIDETFVREFQSSTLAQPIPDELFEQIVAESLKAPAAVWREAFAAIPSMPADTAARITSPTLLLWGDRDALVPRSEQDALLTSIPDSRLLVHEGAGHSPNWEQPALVATEIEAFVRAVIA